MKTEPLPFSSRLPQELKRHKGLLIALISLFILVGSILTGLSWLGNKKTQPVNWIGHQGDPWMTALPHSSQWRELPVLRPASFKEASALQSRPYVILETKGPQKKMVLRAVVDISNADFKKPRTIRVFQNGDSFWLIGNGTHREMYIAQRRPVVVVTTVTPKQVFVTLFADDAPPKDR